MTRDLYKLYNIQSLHKYNKYFKFLLEEVSENNIDESQILPDYLLKDYLDAVGLSDSKVKELDQEFNYADLFNSYTKLFSAIQSTKINSLYYRIACNMEKNETISSCLATFKPSRDSLSKKTHYNLVNNISGRLTVKNGPNILTLPKRHRKILDTRFTNGEVLSLDFSSLEPRLCLSLIGKQIKGDLYDEIKNVLDLDVDRVIIKRAIISVLYGAHYTSLKGLSESRAKDVFHSVKEFFELDKLLEFATNIDDNGLRKNYFGRPLWNLEEQKENILINNYIQSSAVDLALSYFTNLVDKLDTEKFVPIFVLHDAIIFDVNNDYKEEFLNVVDEGYTHDKLGYFPLELDIFNIKTQE